MPVSFKKGGPGFADLASGIFTSTGSGQDGADWLGAAWRARHVVIPRGGFAQADEGDHAVDALRFSVGAIRNDPPPPDPDIIDAEFDVEEGPPTMEDAARDLVARLHKSSRTLNAHDMDDELRAVLRFMYGECIRNTCEKFGTTTTDLAIGFILNRMAKQNPRDPCTSALYQARVDFNADHA